MNTVKITDVADFIIFNSNSNISHRELQKLLYFAQGFYLSKFKEPLFSEELQAWQFGPVNRTIWDKYKRNGYMSLDKPDKTDNEYFSKKITLFLTTFILTFTPIMQEELIDMSHSDSPWCKNYIQGLNVKIEKDDMQKYFEEFSDFDEYISFSKSKIAFSNLIKGRKEYILDLVEIGEEWISGGGQAPIEDISMSAVSFLEDFQLSLFSKQSKPSIPQLVIGPIPSGGIGIELLNKSKNLYLQLHNNKTVEVELELDGNFTEFETDIDQFKDAISVYLEDIS
ncbi:MAG: DUF4065 domain-containing protein [Spirochaetaceae bacterium]